MKQSITIFLCILLFFTSCTTNNADISKTTKPGSSSNAANVVNGSLMTVAYLSVPVIILVYLFHNPVVLVFLAPLVIKDNIKNKKQAEHPIKNHDVHPQPECLKYLQFQKDGKGFNHWKWKRDRDYWDKQCKQYENK